MTPIEARRQILKAVQTFAQVRWLSAPPERREELTKQVIEGRDPYDIVASILDRKQ